MSARPETGSSGAVTRAAGTPPGGAPGYRAGLLRSAWAGQRLRLGLALLAVAAVLLVVVRAERALYVLFEGLLAHQAAWEAQAADPGRAAAGGGLAALADPGGAASRPRVQPLSSAVRETLRQSFPGWPHAGDARTLWGAFNARYLRQLAYTLALQLPVGLAVAALAFVSAVLLHGMQRRALTAAAGGLDAVLDAFPYILWVLPALSLAYWVWGLPDDLRWPYWAYLMILFLGFASFLLPFFIHADRRRLLVLERGGILDGERVTGMSAWALYGRVLRFQLRRLFLYQVLYAALFAMLLEFSAFEIVAFDQPRQFYTVFTQANIYQQQADRARRDAGTGRALSHRALLDALARDPAVPADAPWVRRLAASPAAALDPMVLEAAAAWVRAHLAERPPAQAAAWADAIVARPYDEHDLVFATLARVYFALDAALVFGIFAVLLIGFDLADYREVSHG